ncbi:hypothetical protein JD969_12295 [Planctomycetota bacterium]|nr:hypothetical protein JD969_12295 [Planctomycetota bacterium]
MMSKISLRSRVVMLIPMIVILLAVMLSAGIPLVVAQASGVHKGEEGHERGMMKRETAIVLIGHGVPPSDFPRNELRAAIKALNEMSGHSHGEGDGDDGHDHEGIELAEKLINWPLTRENNPYYFGVKAIADSLRSQSDLPVFIGLNEFCGPTTDQAIETAIKQGYTNLIVTTVMMTPGGGHSEKDILSSMKRAQENYEHVEMTYAWPFPVERIAGVLHQQVMDVIK